MILRTTCGRCPARIIAVNARRRSASSSRGAAPRRGCWPWRERPEPAAFGEPQRRLPRAFGRGGEHGVGVRFPDPERGERARQAARAIAAPLQRSAARLGDRAIVDVTEGGEAFGDRVRIRWRPARPAAFGELATKIAAQAGPAGRVTAGIGQREAFERLGIERYALRRRAMAGHAPCLCHSRAGI